MVLAGGSCDVLALSFSGTSAPVVPVGQPNVTLPLSLLKFTLKPAYKPLYLRSVPGRSLRMAAAMRSWACVTGSIRLKVYSFIRNRFCQNMVTLCWPIFYSNPVWLLNPFVVI